MKAILLNLDFGFDIDNILALHEYVEHNYEEGKHYYGYIQRGDDTYNGLEIVSQRMVDDHVLQRLIQACDGQGSYELTDEDEGIC
tara:strand:+ start:540 stop:794 length:255 start_codon:yes stop_codon:yes gene_type:complete